MAKPPTYEDLETIIKELQQEAIYRKQVEAELRESERLLKKSQAIAHIGSWELNLATNRLIWSDEVRRIFGLERDEFDATYEDFLDSVHPDDRAAVDAAYSGSLREGRDTYEIEHRIVRWDSGEVRVVHEKCEHVKNASGRIVSSIGMVSDITERKFMENTLRISEARYRALFENMLDGIAVYEAKNKGKDFVIVDINSSGEKISKTSREAVIGKSVLKVFPAIREFGLLEVLQTVWKTGTPAQHPIAHYKDDQLSLWAKNSVFKLPTGEVVAVYNDETARRQAEQRLRESEERHRLFFENSSIGIIHYNNKGIITAANDAVIAIFGSSREKLIGLDTKKLPDKKFAKEIYASLKGKLGHYEGDYTSYTGGKLSVITAHWIPVRRNGEIVAGFGLVEDITEKKRAEQALQASEKKYRTLLEITMQGYWLVNSEDKTIEVNEALSNMLGFSQDEMLGKSPSDFVDDENHKILMDQTFKISSTSHRSYEIALKKKNGKNIDLHFNATTIRDKSGNVQGSFALISDITEQKKAQVALRDSEAKLKNKAKDLEELNSALSVLLKKREKDKEDLEENCLMNVKRLIEPYVVKLKRSKLPQRQKTLLNILESNLNEIVTPFTRVLSSRYLNLSPTEIKVANLVKQGKTTKDISEILYVSGRTISFHRENIRKKLGLNNKKTNLKTYLLSIK